MQHTRTMLSRTMTTPLCPVFQKRINDFFILLIKRQVTPWAFLNSGKPMKLMAYDQSQISYEGIAFDGSPEDVFWSGYIEPFMEKIIVNEIDAAIKMAKERSVDVDMLLMEVEGLLLAGVRKTYSEMAKIDQRLKGRNFQEKIPLRSIEKEFQVMKSFIEVRIRSELEMWRPKSKLEAWYERNKFVVWLVGVIVGLYAKFK